MGSIILDVRSGAGMPAGFASFKPELKLFFRRNPALPFFDEPIKARIAVKISETRFMIDYINLFGISDLHLF
jgi:hypothetical protein